MRRIEERGRLLAGGKGRELMDVREGERRGVGRVRSGQEKRI